VYKRQDKYGAELHIKAKEDMFHIQLTTLSKHLNPLITLVSELLFTTTFSLQALEALKPMVLQKIRLQDAQNSKLAQKKLRSQVFGTHHPYGYTLLAAHIEALSPALLTQYHQEHVLNEAAFFLSGDFNKEDIECLQSNFGKAKTPTLPVPEHKLTPWWEPLHIPKKNSLQASIALGTATITKSHADYPSLYITQMLLGGYFGSRLMRYIREEKGYTYGIYTRLISMAKAGYFYMATDVKQDKVPHTLEAIYAQIAQLQTELVPLEELQELKSYLTGHLLTAFQNTFSLANQMCAAHLNGLNLTYYERLYTTLEQITPVQIRAIAQQYLQPKDFCKVVVGGEKAQ